MHAIIKTFLACTIPFVLIASAGCRSGNEPDNPSGKSSPGGAGTNIESSQASPPPLRLPTLEGALRPVDDSTFVATILGVEDDPHFFRHSSDDRFMTRRIAFDPISVLQALEPANMSIGRILQYKSYECEESDDVCVAQADTAIAPLPATPFVAGLQVLNFGRWDDPIPFVSDLVPAETDPAPQTSGFSMLGHLQADNMYLLDGESLSGGPDFGKALTADQFRFVFIKLAAYSAQGAPLWIDNDCPQGQGDEFPENSTDPGIDDLLADYVEGAGASVTIQSWSEAPDRVDRKITHRDACLAARNAVQHPTAPGINPENSPDLVGPGDELIGESCGDGAVQAELPDIAAPVACTAIGTVTEAKTKAELLAWAANPGTSLVVKKLIPFNNEPLTLNTDCNIQFTLSAKFTGVTEFKVRAKTIDFKADVVGASRIELRSPESVTVRPASSITGAAKMIVEAPVVSDAGDAAISDLYCIDANAVSITAGSRDVGGKVLVNAATATLASDFLNTRSLEFVTTGTMSVNAGALVKDSGTAAFSAGGAMTFAGDVLNVKHTAIEADSLTFTAGGRLSGGESAHFTAEHDLLFQGDVLDVTRFSAGAENFHITAGGRISGSETVTLDVLGTFEDQGDILGATNVALRTIDYTMSIGHNISAVDCKISGTELPGSKPLSYCTPVSAEELAE